LSNAITKNVLWTNVVASFKQILFFQFFQRVWFGQQFLKGSLEKAFYLILLIDPETKELQNIFLQDQ